MGEIIAGTYELIRGIGSGSGGNVYLARHLRLNVPVVLKADKRKITTKPELLRREVDVLKELHHSNIPRVFDFFTINNTVYTVMDYIEGESLDHPLHAKVRFPQSQIIRWARQLLDALCYLHSPTHGDPPKGYVHGDIKPANIMLRKDGSICLIDFNIALAIGEENFVGASAGYASPEHYGLDYSFLDPDSTAHFSTQISESKLPTSQQGLRCVVPDARSDIYSLGATLYHLLSGCLPAKNALENVPLSKEEFSPQLVDIISRAMNPNPNLRYQTAEEMLWDFEHLHENDPRTKRLKRQKKTFTAVLSCLVAIGAVLTFSGMRLQNREDQAARLVAEEAEELERIARQAAEAAKEAERLAKEKEKREKSTLELIEAAQSKLDQGNRPEATLLAADALKHAQEVEEIARKAAEAVEEAERLLTEKENAEKRLLELTEDAQLKLDQANRPQVTLPSPDTLKLDTQYEAKAQTVLTEALGVYDLSDGFKAEMTLELPSEPLKLMLSPNGKHLCVIHAWEMEVYDTASGIKLAALPVEPSALSDAVFLNDSQIVYAAPGALSAYDLETDSVLWSGNPATHIAVSGDCSRIAAVYKDAGEALIYDAASGEKLQTVSFLGNHQRVLANDIFTDPKDNLFSLNADGSLLGVSFANGSVRVFDLKDSEGDLELLDPSDFIHFEGGFYNQYFALSAFTSENGGDSLLAIVDTKQLSVVVSSKLQTPFHIQADSNGIFVSNDNTVVEFDMDNSKQNELAYTEQDVVSFCHNKEYTVAATVDKQFRFFNHIARETPFDPVPTDYHCDYVDLANGIAAVGSTDSPLIRILRLETYPEAQMLTYDPAYPHSEARISADRETFMLFRYDRFRLYSAEGELLNDTEIPDADTVYDQQFRREDGESWLDVIYNDGIIRSYSARDGLIISEEQGELPDRSLYEEFLTDAYRITSPLHGAPTVYDRNTGTLIRELKSDAYLTYVTQVGEYIITEYTTTQGERYGLLLDRNLETLARLPNLCDILDGKLYFDYSSGSIRESAIFDRDYLLNLTNY